MAKTNNRKQSSVMVNDEMFTKLLDKPAVVPQQRSKQVVMEVAKKKRESDAQWGGFIHKNVIHTLRLQAVREGKSRSQSDIVQDGIIMYLKSKGIEIDLNMDPEQWASL